MFKNKTQIVTVLVLAGLFCLATFGVAHAAIDGLPDAKLYQPNLSEAEETGGPVVAVLNYIIGLVGLVILGYAVIPLVTDHGLNLIRGKASFRDPAFRNGLLGFIGGAVIILMGVTGKWFEVMSFVWKIAVKMLSKLGGN